MNALEHFRRHPDDLVSALHPLNLVDAVMLALDAIGHPIAQGRGVACDARDFRAAVEAAIQERDADCPDIFQMMNLSRTGAGNETAGPPLAGLRPDPPTTKAPDPV